MDMVMACIYPFFASMFLSCLHSVFPWFSRTCLFVEVSRSSCVLYFPWGFEVLMRPRFGFTKFTI